MGFSLRLCNWEHEMGEDGRQAMSITSGLMSTQVKDHEMVGKVHISPVPGLSEHSVSTS